MSSKTWPIVVGGIAVAGVAALVSVLAFGRDDRPDVERNEVVERWGPAALEREQARARAVAKMREAEQAALVAAEKAKLAAEEEKARQEARAKAIEAARTQGVLGAAALTQGGAFASLTGTGDLSSGFDDVDIQGGLLGNEPGEMAGGFGFGGAGSGPGGGGTGQGTIGLGNYGTLGHGSGTGQGYGVGNGRGGMRGRPTTSPTVRIGTAQVSGELDKEIVRRIVRRHIARITYCYEKRLLAEPSLAGTVTARFVIGADGAVTSSEASGMNDEVAECVAGVIRAMEFPHPKAGTVSVTYPFAMKMGS